MGRRRHPTSGHIINIQQVTRTEIGSDIWSYNTTNNIDF
jgi:hypothetical protein